MATRTRLARAGDEQAISEIRVLGWQSAYRGVVADSYLDAMSVSADRAMWTSHLADEGGLRRTFVIETVGDNRVLGFCTLGPYRDVDLDHGMEVIARSASGTVGEIYAFYVHPDAWGTGVADDLMERALDALATDGWESALLWLLAENPRAHRFYQRHGWAFDGEEQTLPLPGEPREIRLRRLLSRTPTKVTT